MAASDAKPVPLKNTAFRLYFPIYDNDGDVVSSAAGLDSEVSKDGANFADCTNEATEIQSSGIYYLDLTADEMNADCVAILVKTSTTDAKSTVLILYPAENGDIRVDAVQISGSKAAADNVEANIANLDATISSRTSQGSGAITVNYYVYTDEDALTGPIADCCVWVTTDVAGASVVASSTTDDLGKVIFYLDAGTYYFWRKKEGYNFTNPDTETITA